MSDPRCAPLTPSVLRTTLFWCHLAAATAAGLVILLMSATGVLLTYERQLVSWSDREFRSVVTPGVGRLPLGSLLGHLQRAHPEIQATVVTVGAEPTTPVMVASERGTVLVDAYSGRVLGESNQAVRRTLTAVRAWHRWLGREGNGRALARAVIGWANVAFLFIVVSGLFLWFPRLWCWRQLRRRLFFVGAASGKARDFNWHHVVGAWSFVPLLVIVISALPMSFPWANAAVYHLAGDRAPRPRGRSVDRDDTRALTAALPSTERLDAIWADAIGREADWKTLIVRMPARADAPLVFTIDRGTGGQPQNRSTLTVDPNSGAARYETFSTQQPGVRARSMLRFAHTGEVLGPVGQTVAGMASAGACVLAYTGVALAIRRAHAWLKRGTRGPATASVESNAV